MAGTVSHLIRKGCEHDAARIAEIHVKTWQVAYRGQVPDAYLDALDPVRRAVVWKRLLSSPGETVLVALRESRIVGFCDVLRSRDSAAPPEVAEIASIYVEPEAWGPGAGAGLMAAAIGQLREQGFSILTLWVLSTNGRARRFYEKAGFAPDGAEQTDQRHGFPLHELRYRREINVR